MCVRSNIRNWGGFYKIKNILSASSHTVKETRLLTKSPEFSQTVQTPPLLVIPRKHTRTAACCGSLRPTTKSLFKNRKEKAYLGNRLCSFRLFCRHDDWRTRAGGERLGERARYEIHRPFPGVGESRTPAPEEPRCRVIYGEWAVCSSETPSQSFAVRVKTHALNAWGDKAARWECQEELAQPVAVLRSPREAPFWSLGMVLRSAICRNPNSRWQKHREAARPTSRRKRYPLPSKAHTERSNPQKQLEKQESP